MPRTANSPPLPPDWWDGASLSIRHGGLYRCAPGWSIAPQAAHWYCLFYVCSGEGWMELDGHRLAMRGGDLLVPRPGELIAAGHNPRRPVTVYSIGFTMRTADGGDAMRLVPWPFHARLAPAMRRQLLHACAQFVERYRNPATESQIASRGILLQMVSDVMRWMSVLPRSAIRRRGAAPINQATRVGSVRTFIDENLQRPLTTADLARQFHLAPVHLARLLKQEVGAAPMGYIRQRRVARAKMLLAGTDLTVRQVARQVGFDDPFHFSRVFSRLERVSPKAYRQACKRPWFG